MDKTQLKQIAHLAKLSIETDVLDATVSEIGNILALATQMDDIDTQDVTPMAHPLNLSQRLRIDEVRESDERDIFQAIAPKTDNHYYLVPTVIE
jgi:aspartyl-tRNA(Asn)/glutamyl-tRNA(Gln) amidotransferase subunit C